MFVRVTHLDGTQEYLNERVIKSLKYKKENGTWVLTHFNDSAIEIKDFTLGNRL